MIQRTSDVGFSAPLTNQEIARYLLDHHIKVQIEDVNHGYREKALKVKSWIEEKLGDGVSECRAGAAGLYFYLTLVDVETHEASPFFKFLTRTTGNKEVSGSSASRNLNVIYMPGERCVYSKGDMVKVGKRQLRLSYGFEELERISITLDFMAEAATHGV